MKHVRTDSRLLGLLAVIVVGLVSTLAAAQSVSSVPPLQETFKHRNELASPWRDSGCNRFARKFREPGCKPVTGETWKKSHILTLYNEDGSLWYRFSLTPNDSLHFAKNKKDGFEPFAVPYEHAGGGSIVLLPVLAESPNWLKVQVKKNPESFKFISKTDPMWSTTNYEYWIAESLVLNIGRQQYLHDAPGGRVILAFRDHAVADGTVQKIDGDWAFVEELLDTGDGRQGWIRWREDGKILVGCLLNGRRVPKVGAEK